MVDGHGGHGVASWGCDYWWMGRPVRGKISIDMMMKRCTGTKQSFTPGGEPPLVPVPHPGVSIRD